MYIYINLICAPSGNCIYKIYIYNISYIHLFYCLRCAVDLYIYKQLLLILTIKIYNFAFPNLLYDQKYWKRKM